MCEPSPPNTTELGAELGETPHTLILTWQPVALGCGSEKFRHLGIK